MRYEFDQEKQVKKIKDILHNKEYKTKKFKAFSPINPDNKITEYSNDLMCPKCKVQCTGCTGSCTCHPLFH